MQDTFLARATRTISRVFVKKKKDSKASFDPLNSEVPPIVEACCVFLETYGTCSQCALSFSLLIDGRCHSLATHWAQR